MKKDVKTQAPPKGDIATDLRIKRCSVDDIRSMLPELHEGGRFSSFKAKVLGEIRETPEDQFCFIPLPDDILQDAKELASLKMSLYHMFVKLGEPWLVRLNRQKGIFIIARKQDVKSKGGKK